MREILFRAKRIDNGNWVEGDLRQDRYLKTDYISGWDYYATEGGLEREPFEYEIEPETLCQYTGMVDRNGKRIWENDIVKHEVSDTIGTVKWYQEDYVGWCVDDIVIDEQQFTDEMWNECEVIGNIFDNPELLKGNAE